MCFEILDKVRRHLDRRIDSEIEAELLRGRRGERRLVRALEAQHARREVHRARKHPRIDERRFVIGAARAGAPGTIFHDALALTRTEERRDGEVGGSKCKSRWYE